MHRFGKALAGATATATVLGVLAASATASAATVTKKVPAGVETAVGLTACPTGNTMSSVTSSPALPATVNAIKNANKAKLVRGLARATAVQLHGHAPLLRRDHDR